ncbi:MAG: DedA family protein [Thermoplasmata archaeon]
MGRIFSITAWTFSFVLNVLSTVGLPGLFVLMVVESFGIPPLPSEVILPFAGVLIVSGSADFSWFTVLAVALAGGLVGAWLAYEVGRSEGRAFLRRWGGRFGIRELEIARAERLFDRRGEPMVMLSRMVPILRAYISYPAGAARMDRSRFLVFTLVGSAPFVVVLVYLGTVLGAGFSRLQGYFGILDIIVIGALGVVVALWVWRRHRARSVDRMGPGDPPYST